MATEVVATGEPGGGPRGPSEMWLMMQRLDDIRRGQDELRTEMRDQRAEVKEQVAALRRGQDELRAEVREAITGLRGEVKEEITGLRTEMKSEIAGLRTEIASLRNWSLGLLLLAILGLLAKLLIPGV